MRASALVLLKQVPQPGTRPFEVVRLLARAFDVRAVIFRQDDPAADRGAETAAMAAISALTVQCHEVPLAPRPARRRAALAFVLGQGMAAAFHRSAAAGTLVDAARAVPMALTYAESPVMLPYLARIGGVKMLDLGGHDSRRWRALADSAGGIDGWIARREADRQSRDEAAATRVLTTVWLERPEAAHAVRERAGADPVRIDWFRNGVTMPAEAAARGGGPPPSRVPEVIRLEAAPSPSPTAPEWLGSTALAVSYGEAGLPEDPEGLLGRAKVGVLQGTGPAAETAALSAMAAGLPLLAPRDLLAPLGAVAGEHFLAADGQGEVEEALASLLDMPDLARTLSGAGFGFVRDNYSWGKTLERLRRGVAGCLPETRFHHD